MAGNSSSSYGFQEPIRISLADTISQQDRLNMAHKEQKLREQQIEEHKREKQLARDEQLRERLMKIPQNYDSGSGSLNELQGRIIMQAVNRKGEIYNKLRKGELSDSERIKLEIENQTLDMLPANLKVATQNFTNMIGDYQKGVKDGSVFRNLDFEKKVLNGFDSYIGTIDENGNPLLGFQDLDGDGQMDLMPWDNLREGIGVWDFQKKLNYDTMISEMGKGLGTVKTKDREGYDIITEKGIPLEVAQVSANSLLFGPDGLPTDLAKSRLTELGYDYNNPPEEVLKNIELDVTNRLLNSKDRESLKERDSTAEQGALNRAQRERQFQQENSKKDKDKVTIGESVDPTKSTWGNHFDSIAKGAKSVPVTGKVTLEAIDVKENGKDKTYSNVTLNNFTYDKEGRMIITGSYPEGKITKALDSDNLLSDDKASVTENRKMKTIVSKETESRVAQMLGSTVEELQQRANFTSKNSSSDLPDFNELPDFD